MAADSSSDAAALSAVVTSLDDLTSRVTDAAERRNANGDDDVAGDLYEVERTLRTAMRRLERLIDRM